MRLLLGADPEVFYRREGVLTSAHGIIPGNKKNPFRVLNGAVQVDGMAFEFNIDPAANIGEWVFNLNSVLAQLQGMIDGELEIEPVAEFGHEYIESQPEEALELGCEPDFNAWTSEENPRPNGKLPFRTGAGHIHLGFCEGRDPDTAGHRTLCEIVVKQLDSRLGLTSLLLDPCTKRREMYGQAGAYRPKSYGVEYRVLSNFWLKSQELMEWAFNTCHEAIQELEDGKVWADKYPDIQSIINSSDVEAARAIITAEGWSVPNV
jgi:hypothetical protein